MTAIIISKIKFVVIERICVCFLIKLLFMWNFWILVLCSFLLNEATAFLCRTFDKNSKTLAYFCDAKNFETKNIDGCLNESFEVNPLGVTQLKIEGCDRKTVANAITFYQNVRTLDFSYSKYKSSVSDVGFKEHTLDFLDLKHKQVQKINGSYNELLQFPRGFLKYYPELFEIDYSHNEMESIHLNEFDGALKLKRIYLAYNRIRSLQSDDFANVVELEFIDLRHNQIQYYWADVFRYNNYLQTIHLDNNALEYFNCRDFFKMSIATISIPWSSLQNLILTFCDDVKFDVFVNSNRNGFVATTKGKYEIHCNEESFERIAYLSVAPDQVKDISMLMQCIGPSIEDISLDGSSLGKIGSAMLRRFTNLKRISLRNTHLTKFDFSWFINQRQLRELDISNNNLKTLHNVPLSQFLTCLTRLSVAGNQFEHVVDLIENLPSSITSLNLSGSFLGRINSTTFDRLKQLTELVLSRTDLQISNSSNPFEQLQGLTSLDISFNNLETIDFKVLSSTLNKSKVLLASNCNIKNALTLTQQLGEDLEVLDLSGNFLGDLNAATFSTLINLENLYLDNAYISNIDWNTLQRQIKLTDLRITNNKLSEIDLGSVSNSLRWLDLESNELVEMRHLTREQFPNLESLKISNNRLSCDHLMQLKHEWKDKLIHFNLWDQKHKLNCHPSIHNKTT